MYCPWLTLSHVLFAHSGFAKKLPSSGEPCSKNTEWTSLRGTLAIDGSLATL